MNKLTVVSCTKCRFYTDERAIVSQVEKSTQIKCPNCEKGHLKCDHPSSHFDPKKQAFICGSCGEENTNAMSGLKKGLKGMKKETPDIADEIVSNLDVNLTDH